MNIMSKGLICPFCKKPYSFGDVAAACIRLYAMCIVCTMEKNISTKMVTIRKNREIWLDQESKQVFGRNYSA